VLVNLSESIGIPTAGWRMALERLAALVEAD